MPRLSFENYPDFWVATRPAILTAKEFINNLARETRYPIFELVKGQDPFNACQGGSKIEDIVQVRETGTFAFTSPAEARKIRIVNTDIKLEWDWRQASAHVGYTESEYKKSTRGGEKVQVKTFTTKKRNNLRSDVLSGLNAAVWGRPDYTYMEAAGVTTLPEGENPKAYSLLAILSEDPSRFAPPVQNAAGFAGPVWNGTTLFGRERQLAQNFWLRNQQTFYKQNQLADPFNGILNAFDRGKLKIEYEPVPQGGDNMKEAKLGDVVIYTNADGYTTMQTLYRNGQDRFTRRDDAAVEGFAFDGMPFCHVPRWDVENLEQTVGPNAAYQGRPWDAGKPRFAFVNKRHTRPVFDENDMWREKAPMPVSSTQSDTMVVWAFLDYQIVSNAPNRNLFVAPEQPLV